MTCENLDAAADGFSHHVNNAYEKFCPVKIIKCKSNYLFNPSKELLKNIITKRKMYRKYKKFKMKIPNSEKCQKLWDERPPTASEHRIEITKYRKTISSRNAETRKRAKTSKKS